MNDVATKVIAIIAKRKTVEKPTIEPADRLDDLGLDSLNAVELIFDLEEQFGIEIPYNANASKLEFETVGDVIGAIEDLVAKKKSQPT